MVWRLYRDLESLRNQMNRLIDPRDFRSSSRSRAWLPPVYVYESPEEYVVISEIPGADKDKFDVSLTAGNLSIRGEHKDFTESSRLVRSERRGGAFGRVVTLSEHVDPKQVQASFDDGVLTVRVGKTDAARPRQIEVKVS